MSKRDDVTQIYQSTNILNCLCSVLFYINFVFAFLSITLNNVAKDVCLIIQIISALVFFCLSVLDDCICWYNAESARRKSSIENAFNIDMTDLMTDGYYNNELNPSTIKYGMNTFENIFFSENIAKSMIKFKLLKSLFCILVFVVACLKINNYAVTLLIAQSLFSAQILLGSISLVSYSIRLKNLYGEFYFEFVTLGINNKKQVYSLLAASLEYEAIKAHYKVRLSSTLFKKMNPALSLRWDTIRCKVSVAKDL